MNSDKKTLVILTPGFAKDETDSTCIPTQQSFVRTLKKYYPQINIIILALEYPYSKSTYTWFGNPVFSFNGRNKGGLPRLLLRRKVLRTLKKIHAATHIDGLLSFWYGECALAGQKFAGKYGIQHYCWMWGQDAKRNNTYVRRVKLKAGELIAFSDFLQDEFNRNHGIEPAHVITPGISLETFPSGNAEKDIDIIAAGSLIPLKQYSIFINAIAEIKKTIPSVKAVLVGEGPERNLLKSLIAQYSLEANITLTGGLPHIDVLRQMQRSKLFLHPSSYEGFGIVCIEALCAGCEVISFVRPMNKEIENWHIVYSREEMVQKSLDILQKPKPGFESIVPYIIEESVQKMAQLFSF